MMRSYDSGNKEHVCLFVGKEIEKTPAFDMQTLFVVGVQNWQQLIEHASEYQCEHIYLGANQSFCPRNAEDTAEWGILATHLLNTGLWVTLDFDIKYVETVLGLGLNDHGRFIPQISAKIPHINQFNYNACLKIDDKDFKSSNEGVWVYNIHDLQNQLHLTKWSQYSKDQIIK